LIAFGVFAGLAGGIDFLYALSKSIEMKGVSANKNPFHHMKRCKDYLNLEEVYADLAIASETIKKEGVPSSVGPLVIGITGTGRCS
jgi:hypothetical protein